MTTGGQSGNWIQVSFPARLDKAKVARDSGEQTARQRPLVVNILAALAGLGLGITIALGISAESAGSVTAPPHVGGQKTLHSPPARGEYA